MATDLGRLVATLEARADRFNLTLERANTQLDRIARQTEAANERMARSTARLDAALTRVSRGFTALAAAVPVALFARFVRGQFQALDALGDLSQQTGIAATELRQLQVGLELNGGTAAMAGEGLLTFSRTLGQVEAGTGRLHGLLKKLDPAFLENLKNAGSTGEALRLVADRIAVARTEQEKLSIAVQAFGANAGRQFVLLLDQGAHGLDQLRQRLAGLGVDDLDKVTEAARRFDDQLKILKNVTTTQFTKGLFGVGDGLDKMTAALDDEAVKNLGELVKEMGRLAAVVASFSIGKLESLSIFIQALRRGEGFVASVESVGVNVATVEELTTALGEAEESMARAETTAARLRRQTEGEKPTDVYGLEFLRVRTLELEVALAEVAEQRVLADKIRAELARRGELPSVATSAGESGRGRFNARGRPDLEPAGARAPESDVAKAQTTLLRQHEQFVAAMRRPSVDALSEAEQLSVALSDRLAKIWAETSVPVAERVQFILAAVEEGTAAIQQAQVEALQKQQVAVQSFLGQFGQETLNQAQQISMKLAEELGRIGELPGLTPEQKAQLQGQAIGGALPAIRRASGDEQGAVEMDLARRAAEFGGAAERELARLEALLEARNLDEKIAKAYAGDPARIAELQGQNAALLQEELQEIETGWRASMDEIGDLGEQTFGDFLEGIAQGADASASDMVRAFLIGFAKIETAALAVDLRNLLTGAGGEPGSLVGGILLGLGNLAFGTTTGGVEEFAEGGIIKARPGGKLIRVAEGGHDEGVIPLPDGVRSLASGPGALTVKLEQQVARDVQASPLRQARGPSGELILRQMVTQAVAEDLRANGQLAQLIQPNGPTSGLR